MPQNPITSNYLKPPAFMLNPPMDVPPPPPYDPGAPVNVADIMARIDSLLEPTAAPAPPPVSLGGVLKTLLAGLPQAIGVGLSKDPGQALLKQLEDVKAMQFQREQYQQARRDRQEDLRRQVGVNLATGEIEARRSTAKEQRAYENQVRLTGQEQAFRSGERVAAEESARRLAEYDTQAKTILQQNQNDFVMKLQKLKDAKDDMATFMLQREKHRSMGIPDDVAAEMATSDVKGLAYSSRGQKYIDAWTKSEKDFKDKARNLELKKISSEIAENLAQAAHARAAAKAASAKSLNFDWVDKEAWGLTQDGRMVILDKMAKSPTGQYVDEKGLEVTPLDQRQARAAYMMREAQNLMGESKGVGAKIDGSQQRVQAQYYDGIIGADRKAGRSDVEIAAKLKRTAQQQPDAAQFINEALIRNKLESPEQQKKNDPSYIVPLGPPGMSLDIGTALDKFGRAMNYVTMGGNTGPQQNPSVAPSPSPTPTASPTPQVSPSPSPTPKRNVDIQTGKNPMKLESILPTIPQRPFTGFDPGGMGVLPDAGQVLQFIRNTIETGLGDSSAIQAKGRLTPQQEAKARENTEKAITAITQLISGDASVSVDPTGNPSLDALLESVGLLNTKAKAKR